MAPMQPRQQVDAERRALRPAPREPGGGGTARAAVALGARRGRLRQLTITVLCWTRDGLIQWGWYNAGITPGLLAALDQAWLSQGPQDPPTDGTGLPSS